MQKPLTDGGRKKTPRFSGGPDDCVTDWIIEHPETLKVFLEFGIDYSCGGKSLVFACKEQGLQVDVVLEALWQAIEDRDQGD